MKSFSLPMLIVLVLVFTALAGCAKKGDGLSDGDGRGTGELTEEQLRELRGRLAEGRLGLRDVFFEYDRSSVRHSDRPVLNENSKIIRRSSVRHVVIEGYCDTRGTEVYNLALGQRRADSVKRYLVELGVSSGLVTAVSRGETDRFSPGASERSFQGNRRAHFITAE